MLLGNGLSTVSALRQMKETWAKAPEDGKPAWASGELLEVFTQGLMMEVLEFPDKDPASPTFWFALTHDQEQNKIRFTSLQTKAARVPHLLVRPHTRPRAEQDSLHLVADQGCQGALHASSFGDSRSKAAAAIFPNKAK